jgi:hypothetical protein
MNPSKLIGITFYTIAGLWFFCAWFVYPMEPCNPRSLGGCGIFDVGLSGIAKNFLAGTIRLVPAVGFGFAGRYFFEASGERLIKINRFLSTLLALCVLAIVAHIITGGIIGGILGFQGLPLDAHDSVDPIYKLLVWVLIFGPAALWRVERKRHPSKTTGSVS